MEQYISVSEYAAIHGKDPGNIRRHLASGRMQGIRIGNRWILQRDTAYPKDARVRSGKYHNSRKYARLGKHASLLDELKKMVSKLVSIPEIQIDKILLYGSYARGEETTESDVDIAMIIDSPLTREAMAAVIRIASETELRTGKVISLVDILCERYEGKREVLPFYHNIQREGIVLWSKT